MKNFLYFMLCIFVIALVVAGVLFVLGKVGELLELPAKVESLQTQVNDLQLQVDSPDAIVTCESGKIAVKFSNLPIATNLWLVIKQESSGIEYPSDFLESTENISYVTYFGGPNDVMQQDGFQFANGLYTISGYVEPRSKNPQFLDETLIFKDQFSIQVDCSSN